MKSTRVRIPKALFAGILLSLVAFWVVGALMAVIILNIHSSALATIMDYLKLNNYNPAVYTTQLYKSNAPAASYSDAFVETPIAMLVAGVVLGLFMRRSTLNLKAKAVLGVGVGLVFALGIIPLNLILTGAAINFSGGTGLVINPATWTSAVLLSAAAQVVLYTAAYAAGTLLTGRRIITSGVASSAKHSTARPLGTKS